ncbi:MAG: hypothetical protein COA52_00385 [Hyphomicrobiales bacterium]|nr:MAG: hypothetical protein COA52_00385 [Hyphomicrobiales bacterium]
MIITDAVLIYMVITTITYLLAIVFNIIENSALPYIAICTALLTILALGGVTNIILIVTILIYILLQIFVSLMEININFKNAKYFAAIIQVFFITWGVLVILSMF